VISSPNLEQLPPRPIVFHNGTEVLRLDASLSRKSLRVRLPSVPPTIFNAVVVELEYTRASGARAHKWHRGSNPLGGTIGSLVLVVARSPPNRAAEVRFF
jgi:hypothetical protein